MTTAKKRTMRNYLENEGLKLIIWGGWFAVNLYLFIDTYLRYRTTDKYHYLYMLLSESICISRACAAALNFNCAIILIPMCRTLLSFVRTKILKYIHSNPRRLINHMKGLHVMSAYTTCILGVTHALSHLVNGMRMHMNYSDYVPINPGPSKEGTTLPWFLGEVAGYTGIICLVALLIIIITSFKAVRRQKYELFWFAHHFSMVFLVSLCFHGMGGITKYQTNLDKHPRECHHLYQKTWKDPRMQHMCKEPPIFTPNGPSTWKWVIGPLILYVLDRIIRLYRSSKDCKIIRAIMHEGKVLELHMLKKGFKAKPGMYILVQCPQVAEFEWHAFTLTKVPTGKEGDAATFGVCIKVTGNWTEKLKEQLCGVDDDGVQLKRVAEDIIIHVNDEKHKPGKDGALPIIRVDGPYGSPNEDCFRYPVNVSVAAGIGITPFACTLNYLKYLDPTALNKNFKMKRIYLIWVCRDIREFTWFLSLMNDTIKHLESIGMPDMLVVQLYVTREAKLSADDPSMMDFKMQWFQKQLRHGRPKFDDILKEIAINYYKQRIGVFFCGPNPLANILYQSCVKTKHRGNAFIFHKESFA
eukprot:TCONS_00015513-protein